MGSYYDAGHFHRFLCVPLTIRTPRAQGQIVWNLDLIFYLECIRMIAYVSPLNCGFEFEDNIQRILTSRDMSLCLRSVEPLNLIHRVLLFSSIVTQTKFFTSWQWLLRPVVTSQWLSNHPEAKYHLWDKFDVYSYRRQKGSKHYFSLPRPCWWGHDTFCSRPSWRVTFTPLSTNMEYQETDQDQLLKQKVVEVTRMRRLDGLRCPILFWKIPTAMLSPVASTKSKFCSLLLFKLLNSLNTIFIEKVLPLSCSPVHSLLVFHSLNGTILFPPSFLSPSVVALVSVPDFVLVKIEYGENIDNLYNQKVQTSVIIQMNTTTTALTCRAYPGWLHLSDIYCRAVIIICNASPLRLMYDAAQQWITSTDLVLQILSAEKLRPKPPQPQFRSWRRLQPSPYCWKQS